MDGTEWMRIYTKDNCFILLNKPLNFNVSKHMSNVLHYFIKLKVYDEYDYEFYEKDGISEYTTSIIDELFYQAISSCCTHFAECKFCYADVKDDLDKCIIEYCQKNGIPKIVDDEYIKDLVIFIHYNVYEKMLLKMECEDSL